jgi:hypothetical protein
VNGAGNDPDTLRAGTGAHDRGVREDRTGIDVSERRGSDAQPVRTEGLGR